MGNFDGDGDGIADFVMGVGTPSWGASDYNLRSDGSAPGTVVSAGTMAAAGNTGVTVVGVAVDFVADGVADGDWFNNDTDNTSSRIQSVDGPHRARVRGLERRRNVREPDDPHPSKPMNGVVGPGSPARPAYLR